MDEEGADLFNGALVSRLVPDADPPVDDDGRA